MLTIYRKDDCLDTTALRDINLAKRKIEKLSAVLGIIYNINLTDTVMERVLYIFTLFVTGA
jgi:hypothetical protein